MLAEYTPFHMCFFICPVFEIVLPDSDDKGALLCLWIALQSRNTKYLRTCLVNMLVLEHGCMAMTQASCEYCYPRQDAVMHCICLKHTRQLITSPCTKGTPFGGHTRATPCCEGRVGQGRADPAVTTCEVAVLLHQAQPVVSHHVMLQSSQCLHAVRQHLHWAYLRSKCAEWELNSELNGIAIFARTIPCHSQCNARFQSQLGCYMMCAAGWLQRGGKQSKLSSNKSKKRHATR